jgi:hypothetical protein
VGDTESDDATIERSSSHTVLYIEDNDAGTRF